MKIDSILCNTESDIIFFKKLMRQKGIIAKVDHIVANKQYPLVFYVYLDKKEVHYSNLEHYYYAIVKNDDFKKLIDINILKRKEKLKRIYEMVVE